MNLIERLRQRAKPLRERIAEADEDVRRQDLREPFETMLREAADELERLQALVTEQALQILASETQAHDAWEDACRYRWLKKQNPLVLRQIAWSTESGSECESKDVDVVVDAARKEKRK